MKNNSDPVLDKFEKETKEQLEILRCLRPQDRLMAAFELFEFARMRILSTLKYLYPDLNEEQLKQKVKERFSS